MLICYSYIFISFDGVTLSIDQPYLNGGNHSMAQIKGINLRGSLEYNRNTFGEEKTNMIISSLPEEDREIFNSMILDTEWYSMTTWARWLESVVKVNYNGDVKELYKTSAIVAEQQLKGTYQSFLSSGSIESILNRLSTITSRYYKGIETKNEKIEKGKEKITLTGFEKEHQIIQITIEAWWKKLVEILNPRNGKVDITTPISEGKGYMEVVVSWDE